MDPAIIATQKAPKPQPPRPPKTPKIKTQKTVIPPLPVLPAPHPGVSMRKIGDRGYHASAIQDHIEVRMYKREFNDPNELVPTEKFIHLYPTHINDLQAAITQVQDTAKDERTLPLIPIGQDGMHLSLTIFCDQPLAHLRYFERCFWEMGSLYPTKYGIALKLCELRDLASLLPELSAAIMPH